MGIVASPDTVDDIRDVTRRCAEISIEVEDYLSREAYLVVADVESITPEFVAQEAVAIIVGELGELGIYLDASERDLCTEVPLMELVLDLREKFDQDKFYDVIKNREELVNSLSVILSDGEDVLVGVIELMASTFPLDDSWNYMLGMQHLLSDTVELHAHLGAICERAEAIGSVSPLEKADMAVVSDVLGVWSQRYDLIDLTAKSLVGNGTIGEYMRGYLNLAKNYYSNLTRGDELQRILESGTVVVDVATDKSLFTFNERVVGRLQENMLKLEESIGLVVTVWLPGDSVEGLMARIEPYLTKAHPDNVRTIKRTVDHVINSSEALV